MSLSIGKMICQTRSYFYLRDPCLFSFQLVPAILKSLDGKPEPQQDSLLLMMIPILDLVNAPSEDPQVKEVYIFH